MPDQISCPFFPIVHPEGESGELLNISLTSQRSQYVPLAVRIPPAPLSYCTICTRVSSEAPITVSDRALIWSAIRDFDRLWSRDCSIVSTPAGKVSNSMNFTSVLFVLYVIRVSFLFFSTFPQLHSTKSTVGLACRHQHRLCPPCRHSGDIY